MCARRIDSMGEDLFLGDCTGGMDNFGWNFTLNLTPGSPTSPPSVPACVMFPFAADSGVAPQIQDDLKIHESAVQSADATRKTISRKTRRRRTNRKGG